MNPLKKGPELKLPTKMPTLKVPKFLADLYADLRDRRLLPLVAVLAIAIVVVPIALSESGSEEEAVTAAPPVARTSKGPSASGDVVVARSLPGLRSYHQRLAHRTPKDPFRPKYQAHKSSANNTSNGEEAAPPSSGSSEEGTSGSSEGTVTRTITRHFYTWEIDVRVVPVSSNGHPSEAEPTVRHSLPELTPLPGRKTPALTFLQPSADEKSALMLVNPNVEGLFGEAVCVSGGETCQMIALKKGLPETVVYGGNERVFRIELIDIKIVETDPPKATPGSSKNAG